MTTHSTELAVLGAGPGGYAAAFLAADLGMQVTLIDRELNPGGVCVYRGCIPSKALLHAAKLLTEAKHASAWGLHFAEPRIDLDQLRGWKNQVVAKLTGGTGQLGRIRKVRYIQGEATIVDPTTFDVQTADGVQRVSFDHAILATGSRPSIIPSLRLDSPRVMDSSGALELPDIPKTLLVVGGGYIGLELGTVYAALGSTVTVVEMMPGLLPGADRDLVAVLEKRVQAMCEAVLLRTKVVSMTDGPDGVTVTFENDSLERSERVFDKVLVSIGRRPNSEIPRSREHEGRGRREGVHQDRRVAADGRTDSLCHRRRRRRAHARPQGVARGAGHRRGHSRREGDLRSRGHSRRRLHGSRARRGAASRKTTPRSRDGTWRSPSFPGALRAVPPRWIAMTG